jgi:nicotinamidase-related amidase
VTELAERPNTALVVIDVQRGVVADAWERDAVVARIQALVERARAESVPVVWVQHGDADLLAGSEAWELVDELVPGEQEPLIGKQYGDAFEATELEATLARLGVGRLIVTGAQTDQCIRSTIHGALVRGYDTILVGDAHTTEDNTAYGAPPPDKVIEHTNLYWTYEEVPGREAGTVAAQDVSFEGS